VMIGTGTDRMVGAFESLANQRRQWDTLLRATALSQLLRHSRLISEVGDGVGPFT